MLLLVPGQHTAHFSLLVTSLETNLEYSLGQGWGQSPFSILRESSLSFCRNLYCHEQLGILFPVRLVLFLVTHVLHTVSKLVLMVFYHIIFFSDVAIKYIDKNNLKGKAHHGGPSMTTEAGSWLMALYLHTELELKTRSQWLISSSKAPPTDSTVF